VVASFIVIVVVISQCSVSIPFIAGQWSLLFDLFHSVYFLRVSIPFIAGQWSLQMFPLLPSWLTTLFQSPSLRGSGRFFIFAVAVVVLIMFQSPSLRGSGRF